MNQKLVPRVVFAGAALAVVGIILFVILWSALGSLDNFPRLILSMCVPPAVMALIVGIYMLVVRPGGQKTE